jgi:formamidopyrimidine-DNA glycosylase
MRFVNFRGVPELPEVEVLVRHLRPLLKNKTIRDVRIKRARVLRPTNPSTFKKRLRGATFLDLTRRGKYLLFKLRPKNDHESQQLVGHLGMTGRMYVAPWRHPFPKHAAVILNLGKVNFIFEDTRYFGRLTFEMRAIEKLGPEPLQEKVAPESFIRALKRSRQPIKLRLLDQSLVAGVGNIYASEALFRAKISPKRPARKLTPDAIKRLWSSLREVLFSAIENGSTVPLNFSGTGLRDGLFYFGRAGTALSSYQERLLVYGRAGLPCPNCGGPIQRLIQGARSTFYCPTCQRNS